MFIIMNHAPGLDKTVGQKFDCEKVDCGSDIVA